MVGGFLKNNSNNPLLASVLICTRNRATYLGDTIRKAAAQTLTSGSFEIVVVDNGSSDNTPDVVRECQSTIKNVSLRYIIEEEVGLSAARNTAIKEANGQILCFLDDDAVPEPEWLEQLVRGYASNPRVMSVGGAIIPIYEAALPVWFPKDMEFIFKPVVQSDELHRVNYPYYPYGANFSFRAEAVKLVGFFNTSLGYKGKNLIPCEETEFLLRLEKTGYDILMEPRAIVRHIIPANRLTRHYLRRRYYANGRGNQLVNYIHNTEYKENDLMFSKVNKLTKSVVNNVRIRIRFWWKRICDQRMIRPELFYQQCSLGIDLGNADQECKILWGQIWGIPFQVQRLALNKVSEDSLQDRANI
jgi:glycosyltransferase involved in cell wall biosynthesis